jgi:hypothetical protein
MARADLINQIESKLQDTSNATWTAAELGLLLDDALIEVSKYEPYIMRDIYTIESRTGTASATSTSNLVDTAKSQFLSTDVGKVLYNVEDNTWATIVTYSSTSQVGISNDIFTSGEPYEMYNEGCWSSKQININDSQDWLWIKSVVYPVERALYTRPVNNRNYWLHDRNTILEMDVAHVDDSSVTGANVDVGVEFARVHKCNPNTDLAGLATAGYAKGIKSIEVDGLTDADSTIFKDTLFYFSALWSGTARSRLWYRVTADAAISSNAATISFFPGLESLIVNNEAVTFVKSTLTPELERLVIDLVVGEAMMSEGISKIAAINTGGVQTPDRYYSMGEKIAEKARMRLKALVDVDERAEYIYSRV